MSAPRVIDSGMPLITLFSAPKPFRDPHIALIQRNALQSWVRLPETEVLLLGDEAGLAQAAREFGGTHLPQVKCNSNGIPLISSMLQLAREQGRGELLCIINADMLLMGDFVQAARRAMALQDRFVLLGRRWDCDITTPLAFSNGWEAELRRSVENGGQLHRPAGSDFFLFPRACYQQVPDFAIGRAGWDNWMIYEARHAKWPVIDCTPSVTVVHQNHDYSHLPGAKPHYEHPDSDENIRLAGGPANVRYTILDSTRELSAQGSLVRPGWSYLRMMRGVELGLRAIFFFLPGNMLENVARPKRWKKRLGRLFGQRG
jgi:hypothetical protein